jgi:hypothetical protein
MGIFSKKVRNVTWSISDETYSVWSGKEEITSECTASFAGEDLLLYHPHSESYFLLPKIRSAEQGVVHDGITLGRGHRFAFFKEGDDDFRFYDEGEDVINDVEGTLLYDSLWVWHPTRTLYFKITDFEDLEPDAVILVDAIAEGESLLYVSSGKGFNLLDQGERVGERCSAVSEGEDLIVYYESIDKQLFYPGRADLYRGEYGTHASTENGKAALFRKLPNMKFHFIFRGKQVAGQAKIITFLGKHNIVFLPDIPVYFWVENGRDLEVYGYRVANPIIWGSDTMWATDGENLFLVSEGENISNQVEIQRNGNDAVAMMREPMKLLVMKDFFSHTDNKWRAIEE